MIRKFISILFFTIFLAAGCVHQTTVVLVPDRDGHVGKVAVQNRGGEQLLSEPGKAVVVWNEILSPRQLLLMNKKSILHSGAPLPSNRLRPNNLFCILKTTARKLSRPPNRLFPR